MSTCLVGLGSNLGDRRQGLDEAVGRLSRRPGIRLLAQSPWIETRPAGGPAGQPLYLDGAALLETSLPPEALLETLQAVEAELGRPGPDERGRWSPRPIDLDLLLYDDIVRQTPALTLPHPRMTWRRFVLEPATAVAPALRHPLTGWTIQQHLDHLNNMPLYMAITGPLGTDKSGLAAGVARQCGAAHCRVGQAERSPTNGSAAKPGLRNSWWDCAPLVPPYERIPPHGREICADPAGCVELLLLQFLSAWPTPLAAARPEFADPAGVVGDFWFDEALAFARTWLPPERLAEYHVLWEQARAKVSRPRLVVLLDVPVDNLFRRLHGLGRRLPCTVTREQLAAERQTLVELAAQPGQGPVLRLETDEPERALPELLSAMEAMK